MRVPHSPLGAGAALLCGAIAVLLLGGCSPRASAKGPEIVAPTASPTVTPTIVPVAAAQAGGACQLLDFEVIAEVVGVRFDVAAAARQGGTYTCAIQSSENSLPDLVLTISPTTAGAAVFRGELEPEGARAVTALGKAAYRATTKATKAHGPTVEVGWLSADKKLIMLRLTLAVGSPEPAADNRAGRLVTLAKKIDLARA